MQKVYYRLSPEFALRGYPEQPSVLIRLGEAWSAPISQRFMDFLRHCDGAAPFYPELMFADEAETVRRCLDAGLILPSEEPVPVRPQQRYRAFDHARKYLAQWSITGRCNLHCRHCFVMSKNAGKDIRECTVDEASHIVSRLAEYGVETVMLTGGEPLLHPQFTEIVRSILNAGMTVNWINTNGIEGGARDIGLMCEETSILRRSLDEIYRSSAYARFGSALTAADIRKNAPHCADCARWEYCYGGQCRVNALIDGFRRNGRYCIEDVSQCDAGACIFIRGGYREQLAQVLKESEM